MIANVLFKAFMWYVKTPAAPLAIGPEVFRAPHIKGSPNENKHIGNGYFLAIIKSVSFVYLSSLAVAAFDRTDRGQYTRSPPGGRGETWVNFCWVCAAGLSEPVLHYSLFCGRI